MKRHLLAPLVAALGLGTGFRCLGENGPTHQGPETGQAQGGRGQSCRDASGVYDHRQSKRREGSRR